MAASNVAVAYDRPAWAKGLTDKEFAWVSLYLIDFNGAGASAKMGAPPASAKARAYEVKIRPHVRAAINAAMKEAMPAIKMTIAERLAAIVTTDIGDVVDWAQRRVQINHGEVDANGRPKKARYAKDLSLEVRDLASLSPSVRAAVKAVRKRVTVHGTSLDVIMHDPVIAAERLQSLLELTKENPLARAGSVVFVIEAPDGTVVDRFAGTGKVIEGDSVGHALAADTDSQPEDLPPGKKRGKLVIEAL